MHGNTNVNFFLIIISGVTQIIKFAPLHRTRELILFYNSLLCSLLSSGILHCTVQRATIPDAVIIEFVLLKMGMLMLETCRGL